jgi:alpha-L-fucosidase
MKNILVCLIASLLAGFTFNVAAADAPDLKYGLVINYSINSFAQAGEQGQITAERFNPAALDVKAWAHAAKQAGMTFAVLMVKNGTGFCLWDSLDYDYDVGSSPFKGDIIGDFIAACNAEGILPGAVYDIPDRFNEGEERWQGPVPPPYFNLIKKHITELHTKYPGLRVFACYGDKRLSSEQAEALKQLIHKLNPQCVVLDKNSHGIGGTVIKSWEWQAEAPLVPAQEIFDKYCKSDAVIFLTNVGPTPQGIIPAEQLAIVMQLKELIAKKNASAAAGANMAPADAGAKPDAAERLKKVKSLYDQSLINKEDYDKKVKEIMDSL